MTRRNKPKTPAQIAAEKLERRRRDFEAAEMPTSAASLATNEDVEVRREGQRNVLTARRTDVFDLLKPGMAPGAYDAARRLERDILVSMGQHDYGRTVDRVDCEQAAYGRVDQIMWATERVLDVLNRIPIRDALILRCLIAPKMDATWRASITRLTGETHPHAQGAVVRGACLNLRDAYASMERRRVA